MHDEDHQQPDPGDPDASSVQYSVEEFSVFIEGLTTDEDQQVSRQMPGQKRHQGYTGDGNDELFSNGGGPVSAEAAGKGVHEGEKRPYGVAGRGINRESGLFKGRLGSK